MAPRGNTKQRRTQGKKPHVARPPVAPATTGSRFLVKVRQKAGREFEEQRLGVGGELTLTPLFRVNGGRSPGVAPGEEHRWYVADLKADGVEQPWDAAHEQLDPGKGFGALGLQGVVFVEPDLVQQWLPPPALPKVAGPTLTAFPGAGGDPPDDAGPHPQLPDPFPRGPDRHWHLRDDFSGLARARQAADGGKGVLIAHLDTGFDPGHLACPDPRTIRDQHNYVDPAFPTDASDRTPTGGILRNRGHGTATLGILAGGVVGEAGAGGVLDARAPLGGAPAASLLLYRIADSVVRFYSSAVARAIDDARTNKANVLSMSMGGVASAVWADAVNLAYDAGVVLVTAAGNNYGSFPTRFIVYPARFRRVLAACGVMADGRAYFGLPIDKMQGNHGPRSKMATALSAYTPNISWTRLGSGTIIDSDGQGTSAATPQVAAAAALYFAKYKKQLLAMEGWQRVEAVRQALFESAYSGGGTQSSEDFESFGRGVLRAAEALRIAPKVPSDALRQPPDSASFAFLKGLFGLGLTAEDPRAAMFRLEMTQLAQTARALEQAIPDPDLEAVSETHRRRFFEAVLAEPNASRALKNALSQRLRRSPGGGLPPSAGSSGPVAGPLLAKRLPSELVPPARRLRVFAVDPSYGTSLSTAFLNETTVEVPWERSRAHSNLLAPGPVGEYLEVVDIDPAAGVAYAPVDLNDPSLLAQDGLPPSEGNPQFHQQMVYAVAMRTIGHFERALGRVALWAPRVTRAAAAAKQKGEEKATRGTSDADQPFVETYVQRLRIYPHALLQKNAFYSPEKRALLLGYFPAAASQYSGAASAMVFTCLSHDIVAHETSHALLDGVHPRLREVSNGDVLAFHEAFADIVAIFQHFGLREVLIHEIREAKGDFKFAPRLAALAQQFGQTAERSVALRSALGGNPKQTLSPELTEPHARGSILVAAVFDAFLAVYARRTADLFRLASGGISNELVERLADEAVKTSGHILDICIRALDYLPPVDVTFGDYLRALVTADQDLVPKDTFGYRVAFLEAFRGRGIILSEVRTYSVESACWKGPSYQPPKLSEVLPHLELSWDLSADRLPAWEHMRYNARVLHEWLTTELSANDGRTLGLNLERDRHGQLKHKVEVHSVRPARRVAHGGTMATDLVVVITQKRHIEPEGFEFRGGCTLLIDMKRGEERVRYAIVKQIDSDARLERERAFRVGGASEDLAALYFGEERRREPFAFTHLLASS